MSDTSAQPYMLTVDEAARDYLRTTRKAVYALVGRGQIPGAVKLGRRLLFRRSDLVEFLAENSVPSPWETKR